MVKVPALMIILGGPASGKTTLARQLAVDFHVPCVVAAVNLRRRSWNCPGPRWVYAGDSPAAYPDLLQRFKSWGL